MKNEKKQHILIIEDEKLIAYDIDNVNTLTILAKANFIIFLACIIFLNYDFK